MEAAEVWSVVLGAVVALAGTLIAQWSSLAYQTRRQREVRWTDFQRSTLLQVREMLGEVKDAVSQALAARRRLRDEFDRPDVSPGLREVTISEEFPEMVTLGSLIYRFRLVGVGLEHEPLRIAVEQISRWAWKAPLSTTNTGLAKALKELYAQQHKAVRLLGEQLRRLS